MPTITTKDGASIYYKDWGTGQPITFSHGWPLTADAWDAQMLFLGQQGYRVIAHDRRGNGRSTGGGEVARYLGRHGTSRVAKAVLIGAVPPLMLKTDKNPEGLPISAFDDFHAAVANDRSQFYKELPLPFYGF